MTTQSILFAYIGVNKAGSARAICRDDPGEEKSTARIVAGWIKMGRTVERLPMEDAMRRIEASINEDRNPEPTP